MSVGSRRVDAAHVEACTEHDRHRPTAQNGHRPNTGRLAQAGSAKQAQAGSAKPARGRPAQAGVGRPACGCSIFAAVQSSVAGAGVTRSTLRADVGAGCVSAWRSGIAQAAPRRPADLRVGPRRSRQHRRFRRPLPRVGTQQRHPRRAPLGSCPAAGPGKRRMRVAVRGEPLGPPRPRQPALAGARRPRWRTDRPDDLQRALRQQDPLERPGEYDR
jgi:hypothetical protein